jgi:hypothetical protein
MNVIQRVWIEYMHLQGRQLRDHALRLSRLCAGFTPQVNLQGTFHRELVSY